MLPLPGASPTPLYLYIRALLPAAVKYYIGTLSTQVFAHACHVPPAPVHHKESSSLASGLAPMQVHGGRPIPPIEAVARLSSALSLS